MTRLILVTGGTGNLGGRVVPLLRAAGRPVRVLSRTARPAADGVQHAVGDLNSGAGVAAALAGVDTVVHCAGAAKGDGDRARLLVTAAAAAGVRHVVNISVVGAERVPVVSAVDRAFFGYYAGQREAEVVIAGSAVPWTNLRATQFHDLVLTVAQGLSKLPVVLVPRGARAQPIDVTEVAARLAELALGEPAGQVPDLAGPRAYGLDELVRGYLRAAGKRRPMVSVPAGGGAYRALVGGANLAPDRAVGRRTWEEFLADRVPAAS